MTAASGQPTEPDPLLNVKTAPIDSSLSAIVEPPFTLRSIDEAKELSRQGRLVLIAVFRITGAESRAQFTMWHAEPVVAWLTEHAAALGLRSMGAIAAWEPLHVTTPAVLAFKEGREIDRDTVFRDTSELMEWLRFVERGSIPLEFATRRAGPREDRCVNSLDHLALARRHRVAGRMEDAAEELDWIWRHADGINWPVEKFAVGAESIELIEVSPPVRTRFVSLRNDLGARCLADPNDTSAEDSWLSLQKIVPDGPSFLRWAKEAPPNSKLELSRRKARDNVIDALCSDGRWKEASSLIENPREAVEWAFVPYSLLVVVSDAPKPKEHPAVRQAALLAVMRCGVVYACLLADGREEAARTVVDAVLEKEAGADTKLLLVIAALQAGQPRNEHLQWAEEWDTANPDKPSLRDRVQAKLAEHGR